MRPFQWAILATCMLVLVCDGIDLQLLGILAPVVMESLDVDRGTFGIAMGTALVGFGLGSWGGGWLGDRIGRRYTLALAALVFSLATIGASTAAGVENLRLFGVDAPLGVWEMAGWRLFGGLGFGAAYSNALALASEWLAEKWRPVAVSTLSVGTPIGGSVVGWIAPALAQSHGWQGAFLGIGIGTLTMVALILLVLRDSPAFLMARGKVDAAQQVARERLGQNLQLLPEAAPGGGAGEAIGVLHRSNLRLNIGIGLAFAAAALVAYGILNWTTTMLTAKGFSLGAAGNAVAVAGITSMVGSILAGILVRHFGSRRVMASFSAFLVVVLITLGTVVEALPPMPDGGDILLVTTLTGAAGFFFSASIAAMYVMMALGYPQSCRSAGIGFGIFMSRLGAVSASVFGGSLLELGGASTWPFFLVLIAGAVLIAAAAIVVDRQVPPVKR